MIRRDEFEDRSTCAGADESPNAMTRMRATFVFIDVQIDDECEGMNT